MKVFSKEKDSYYSRMDPIGPLPSWTYQQWRICKWHDSAGCLLVSERWGGMPGVHQNKLLIQFENQKLLIITNRPNTAISFNTNECGKSIIGTYRLNRNNLFITVIQLKKKLTSTKSGLIAQYCFVQLKQAYLDFQSNSLLLPYSYFLQV